MGDEPDSPELDADTEKAVTRHVLREVHPDRLDADVVDAVPTDDGHLVGVKVAPRGYLSTAKYALVQVDDGAVVGAEACTGRTLRRELAAARPDDR